MKKSTLSYGARQALAGLAMANLSRQKPGDEKYRGAVKETPAQEFARMRREEIAANGDISPLQQMTEDRDGTTARKTALRKIWASPSDKLQSMAANPRMRLEMVDGNARWPKTATLVLEMTEESAEKISGHAKDFFDSKILTDDDRNRIVLFVGINSEANSLIDPCNPEIWPIAYDRLRELGCLNEVSEQLPTPAQTQAPEQPADALLEEAHSRFFAMFEDVWYRWMASLKINFEFEPTLQQKEAALKMIERLGMGDPEVFNNTRRALGRSGVWPNLATEDELLCDKMDADGFRLDTAAGRLEFGRAKNQVMFGTLDHNVIVKN